MLWVKVPAPRSSTHCELVALCLAMAFDPPQVLSDSLTSLSMVKGWGAWSASRILKCADRAEVRRLLHMAKECSQAPLLEKVKAHDEKALELGVPKAVGNDRADQLAKRAAHDAEAPVWEEDPAPFGDPVELLDAGGKWVPEVRTSLSECWWRRCLSKRSRPRRRLDALYPKGVSIL